jgi:hypothetical protein
MRFDGTPAVRNLHKAGVRAGARAAESAVALFAVKDDGRATREVDPDRFAERRTLMDGASSRPQGASGRCLRR